MRLAFGHSFGGNIVLGLAQRRPELVERVAIYETPAVVDAMVARRDRAAFAALGAADPADAAEAFMRRLVGDEKWDAPSAVDPLRTAGRGRGDGRANWPTSAPRRAVGR